MRLRRLSHGVALFAVLAVLALIAPTGAAADAQPRIVGGTTASISQFPWQAAVVFSPSKVSGNAHQRQFCGGSLLTSRIVMTAGHCVYDTDPDCGLLCSTSAAHLDPSDVDVVLGRTTLSDASQGAELGVIGVSYDSHFTPDTGTLGVPSYDVAFLVLGAASSQPPIKIARADESGLWAPGSPEAVSGWGVTSPSATSTQDTLRAAGVSVIDDSTCGSPAVYAGSFNSATMLCAGNLSGGADACYGDSGGPLQAPLPSGGYRQVGVVSWGVGCGTVNKPGVYTRVAGSTMAPLIQADVSQLESSFGLPAEGIFAGPTQAQLRAAKKALKKCKRIRNKKKRRRCKKRVHAKLQI